ncbi:unnamed protein product [Gongylonema pulchrum]|uniref:Uncharacterized protein n=1 Tax=Gongylonema pulchrum TaxID=637853 RepID=A0A183DEK8_9BILA|nr:unnamed protein product [Gongylonema pulchrum]
MRWESNGEFWETGPKIPRKRQTTTTIGVGADGGIILARCSQETASSRKTRSQYLSHSLANNTHPSAPELAAKRNKQIIAETTPSLLPHQDSLHKPDVSANLKTRLAFLSARRRLGQNQIAAAHLSQKSVEAEKKSTMIGIKRTQEFRDAICTRPPLNHKDHKLNGISKLPQSNAAPIYSGTPVQNPYFPQNDRLLQLQLQSPNYLSTPSSREFPIYKLSQPESGFAPFTAIPYGSIPFLPPANISASSLEDFCSKNPISFQLYNASTNSNSHLLHPDQARLYPSSPPSSALAAEEFLRAQAAATAVVINPSVTGTAVYQQYSGPLLNADGSLTTSGTTTSGPSNRTFQGTATFPQNQTEQKSPFRDG